MEGPLQIWWWGEPGAKDVVIMSGGAMGGVTGPGRALYVELATSMAAEGRAAIAVEYRKAGDLSRSLLDTCATVDLAVRNGAECFVVLGHSFGGAVAA